MTPPLSITLRVGHVGDKLTASVAWWAHCGRNILVATVPGKTRVERLKRRPTVCAIQCAADDVSRQPEEYAEV